MFLFRAFKFHKDAVESAEKTLPIYKSGELAALERVQLKDVPELHKAFQDLKQAKGEQLTQTLKSKLRAWFQFPPSSSHLRGERDCGKDGKSFVYKASKYKEPSYTFYIQGQ